MMRRVGWFVLGVVVAVVLVGCSSSAVKASDAGAVYRIEGAEATALCSQLAAVQTPADAVAMAGRLKAQLVSFGGDRARFARSVVSAAEKTCPANVPQAKAVGVALTS